MRYLEELGQGEATTRLGISAGAWHSRLFRARRNALALLVEQAPHRACGRARGLLDREQLAGPEAIMLEAHLEECVHCRAWAERRSRRASLVALPALLWLAGARDRLLAWLPGGGESIGGSVAGAGTVVGGGLAVKAAATCTTAAVLAVCLPGHVADRRADHQPQRDAARAAVTQSSPRPRRHESPRSTPAPKRVPTPAPIASMAPPAVSPVPVVTAAAPEAPPVERAAGSASTQEFGFEGG